MPATTGTDTTRVTGLFARIWRPTAVPRGVFVLLHGMESHSGWFGETASRLVEDGWAVLAYDRAGWGQSPGERGQLGSYRDFVEEASLMVNAAREIHPSVHLAGMSWGGMATLYLGLRRGWLFDSIALLSPGLAARRDISAGGKLRVATDFFRGEMTRRVRPNFDPAHFTGVPKWQEFIAQDPHRVHEVGTGFCFETVKMRRFIQEQAGRRRVPPALCLLAGNDAIIDNAAAGDLCQRAGVAVTTVPDSAHTLIFDQPETTVRLLSEHAAAAGRRPGREGGNIWVAGAGAVGGAVASLLTFGGRRTGVLVKPSHLEDLRPSGIRLRTGNAQRDTEDALSFADSPGGLPPGPELVILAVKSFDTAAVLQSLAGSLTPETILLSLQNGVGNEEKIAAAFPDNTVVAGSICASLELTGPGRVLWADDRGGLAGAIYKGNPERARRVWDDNLPDTGMECAWVEGANASERLKWSKLMLNIGFNALNSVTGLSSASLLKDPATGNLAIQALREGFAAMRLLSLDPVDLPGVPVSKLRFLVRAPLGVARKVMAWQAGRNEEAAFSMRQDILKKRQHTEIQEINGKIVEVLRRFNVNAAANAKLVDMVEKIS